jgi:tetratricopeptide (TPR) repeat protein
MDATLLSPAQHQAIRDHLARVLASPQFASAERQTALLRFLAEHALAGESEAVKESVIAASLYRFADYDPQIHSTVRVDIGRLRQRLRDYYEGPGAAEPVRIAIPRGSYTPDFEILTPAQVAAPAAPNRITRRQIWWAAGALATAGAAGAGWQWSRMRRLPEAVVEIVPGSSGRPAHDAVVLASALERKGLRVRASWTDAPRPLIRVMMGVGPEDERRHLAAMFFTDVYEFPARSAVFVARDSAELETKAASVAETVREHGRAIAAVQSAQRTPERSRSIEVCRRLWRERLGHPDFTVQREDPPMPLPKLMDMAAQLERAVAVDSGFACAHAELAWIYRLAAEHDDKLYEKSRTHAEQAVRLDSTLGFAQFVLGYVRFFSDWKFREAFDRWLLAARSHPLRLSWYRYVCDAALLVGEHKTAEAELDRGLALLPNAAALLAASARIELYRRDWAAMERRARKLVSLEPGLHTGHLLLARALMLQGKLAEAEPHLAAAAAPDHPRSLSARARLHALRGNRRGVEQLLTHPQLARFPSITGANYAILGDTAKAEEHFQRALERRDQALPYLLAEPEPRLDGNDWLNKQAATLGIKRS